MAFNKISDIYQPQNSVSGSSYVPDRDRHHDGIAWYYAYQAAKPLDRLKEVSIEPLPKRPISLLKSWKDSIYMSQAGLPGLVNPRRSLLRCGVASDLYHFPVKEQPGYGSIDYMATEQVFNPKKSEGRKLREVEVECDNDYAHITTTEAENAIAMANAAFEARKLAAMEKEQSDIENAMLKKDKKYDDAEKQRDEKIASAESTAETVDQEKESAIRKAEEEYSSASKAEVKDREEAMLKYYEALYSANCKWVLDKDRGSRLDSAKVRAEVEAEKKKHEALSECNKAIMDAGDDKYNSIMDAEDEYYDILEKNSAAGAETKLKAVIDREVESLSLPMTCVEAVTWENVLHDYEGKESLHPLYGDNFRLREQDMALYADVCLDNLVGIGGFIYAESCFASMTYKMESESYDYINDQPVRESFEEEYTSSKIAGLTRRAYYRKGEVRYWKLDPESESGHRPIITEASYKNSTTVNEATLGVIPWISDPMFAEAIESISADVIFKATVVEKWNESRTILYHGVVDLTKADDTSDAAIQGRIDDLYDSYSNRMSAAVIENASMQAKSDRAMISAYLSACYKHEDAIAKVEKEEKEEIAKVEEAKFSNQLSLALSSDTDAPDEFLQKAGIVEADAKKKRLEIEKRAREAVEKVDLEFNSDVYDAEETYSRSSAEANSDLATRSGTISTEFSEDYAKATNDFKHEGYMQEWRLDLGDYFQRLMPKLPEIVMDVDEDEKGDEKGDEDRPLKSGMVSVDLEFMGISNLIAKVKYKHFVDMDTDKYEKKVEEVYKRLHPKRKSNEEEEK